MGIISNITNLFRANPASKAKRTICKNFNKRINEQMSKWDPADEFIRSKEIMKALSKEPSIKPDELEKVGEILDSNIIGHSGRTGYAYWFAKNPLKIIQELINQDLLPKLPEKLMRRIANICK